MWILRYICKHRFLGTRHVKALFPRTRTSEYIWIYCLLSKKNRCLVYTLLNWIQDTQQVPSFRPRYQIFKRDADWRADRACINWAAASQYPILPPTNSESTCSLSMLVLMLVVPALMRVLMPRASIAFEPLVSPVSGGVVCDNPRICSRNFRFASAASPICFCLHHTYVCVCVCVCSAYTYACKYASIYACMFLYIHRHTHTHTHIKTNDFFYIRTCTHTHTHTTTSYREFSD